MSYPNPPLHYAWLFMAQLENRYTAGTKSMEKARHVNDRNLYPFVNFTHSDLEIQYDFKNGILCNLPSRIHKWAYAHASMQKHRECNKGIDEKGVYCISDSDVSNFAPVENLVVVLVWALLIKLSKRTEVVEIPSNWRTSTEALPIRENMDIALDLLESTLLQEYKEARRVMVNHEAQRVERLLTAFRVIQAVGASPDDLFFAHTLIADVLITKCNVWQWEDSILVDVAALFSRQWLEKSSFRAMFRMPSITVPQIEQECKGGQTGKKKIGRILLAVDPAVSVSLSREFLQTVRNWTE